MSSFLLVVLVILVIALIFVRRRNNQKHPGFGAVLVFKEADGTVWVASRLFHTPVYRHGILLHSQLVSVDGVPMHFASGQEFEAHLSSKKLKAGDKECWVTRFDEGKEIVSNLVAELVPKEIPVYWSPNPRVPGSLTNEGKTSPSLEYCNKTGEYVQGGRLSIEALKEAFSR